MTEKLERATEKIQILQTQVDDVHESAALISNLTEANLELDEVFVVLPTASNISHLSCLLDPCAKEIGDTGVGATA